MEPLLHPVEPTQLSWLPFVWACELARKVRSDVIVLGSRRDFLSSEAFRTQVEKLSRNYHEMYHPPEDPLAPRCIPVLSDEELSIGLPAHSQENPVSLIVFPHHFSYDQSLFQQLDEQQHPYVHLPPELPPDPIRMISVEGRLPQKHTFYDIYYRATKNHLPDDFIRQLAKDTHLSEFLVDHFRQQAEAPEEM